MIGALFRYNLRANRILWLALFGVMMFYHTVILMMYDPQNIEAVNAMFELFPQELMQALGFVSFGSTLIEFVVGYIYGFLIYLFPMVLAVVINHRLVAAMVDRGSMAYVLASPNSRIRIILTQIIFSVLSMAVFFALMSAFVLVLSQVMFPDAMDVNAYLTINLYNGVQYFALGALLLFSSTWANDSTQSLSLGVGLPVSFLVIQMASNLGGEMELFKYATLYSLFDPKAALAGEPRVQLFMAILLAIGLVFYGASVVIFNRKNLYV